MRRVDDMAFTTVRLLLNPLVPADAEEMAKVLADERLHEYIGGHPATAGELRTRYQKFAAGSGRPAELWLNWSARRRVDRQAVGTIQATVVDHDDRQLAYVAWVIGVRWQNAGYATEAAQGLVAWLHSHGVGDIVARIHPDHQASARVAARAGLKLTDEYADGERVWRSTSPSGSALESSAPTEREP